MNDTTSSPSRLLKITAVTARWLLGLSIAAWLLFVLSVLVLHGWIVPRIGDYRSALENQASRVIGVPVRIGSITARSVGLFPTFELRDVALFDSRQQEALRLTRVVASVSPRSLWRLSFEQLYLESPALDMRRDALGKLHIAGLDVSQENKTDTASNEAIDWFFSQREFVVEGGTVRWTDEMRRAEPLMLTDVRFIARNSARRHALRLDATPPTGWGERFTLRGQFRQPLLSVRRGNWQTWNGTLYAELPQIDVSRLGRYVTLDDSKVRQGNGALRIWSDIMEGKPVGGAADLALTSIDVSLGDKLEALALHNVRGRVAGKQTGETLEFSTTDLQFDKVDGSHWPGGNLWFQHTPQIGRTAERSALRADKLDLAALAQIASRLPLGDATHEALATYAPRGLVERIDASWQGALASPSVYQVKGRVSGLQVASQPAVIAPAVASSASVAHPVGTPGVRGAVIEFDASQTGGHATVGMTQGALDLPGVFEESVIPIDQLSGQAQWQIDGPKLQVQIKDLHFANADAEGQTQVDWRTSDPATSPAHNRYPGVLDLKGQLTRANGTRVFRYLPLHIPKVTRDYVRDAVTHGTASTVDFVVQGDLHDMPFADPKQGNFRIASKVNDVTFDYVPQPVAASSAPPSRPLPPHWPALTGLSGDLIFERAGMQVRNARGHVLGAAGIDIVKADATIADLSHHAPLLQVNAQARGPLDEALHVTAPMVGEAADMMKAVRATGNADYRLKLDLPLAALDRAKVQVGIVLAGNDVQLMPAAPSFTQARGTLNFTETGFALAGVQARLVGGDVRVEGKGRYAGNAGASPAPDLSFSASGTVTAEGLRNQQEVDWLSRLAGRASGSTSYAASLSVQNGVPEFSLTSSLQGLALQLPAPLEKAVGQVMPLRIERKIVQRETRTGGTPTPTPLRDQITLELGRIASARYVRDLSGSEPRVVNGDVQVGLETGESTVMPERGVIAHLNLGRFDLDAWQAVLNGPVPATGTGTPVAGAGTVTGAPAGKSPSNDAAMLQAYLPGTLALRAQELSIGGRKLRNVVAGGSREGLLWRGNVSANELDGYVEYRQPPGNGEGRVYARLARLKIEPGEAREVESLLDSQVSTLPALDIVIDDFELLGKRLGRAEINAVNRGGVMREWRLNQLSFTTPEASFQAKGTWANATAPGTKPGAPPPAHHMTIDFTLDMSDTGALLARLGMHDVVRRGKGRMQGEVGWSGSPFSLDYPSLNGQLNINVEQGQFLKADPGLAKLLGVLSLQALPRRLTLDFRDVFSQGFAFDFIRGDASIKAGSASTNNLQMKGVNAAVLMSGSADLAHETQKLHVVIVPEIDAGTAALVATAINPAIGLATFLAQMVLRVPLIAAATQEFDVDGSWADPKITKVPRRPSPDTEARKENTP
jgi:uncharacterized protein (TIGR02099 family)